MLNFNENDFRKCLGSFVTGVTIITIMDKNGQLHGVTVSSFASMSLDPPMISFNLGKQSSIYKALMEAKHLNVNILSATQQELSKKFAQSKEPKWDKVAYTTNKYGCPILNDVIAVIECRKSRTYNGGDHSIITANVINLSVNNKQKPLIYYKGGYFGL